MNRKARPAEKPLEVSSVVESILTAFQNGMDIFRRFGASKQRKGRKPPRMRSDELKLHDSLTNRPKEIEAEYAQSVIEHGRRFEKGDDQAYTSLARVLFVLNTGLMSLINNALSHDVADKLESRQSLLLLSESAAADTMHAFNQLRTRLSSISELALLQEKKPHPQKLPKQAHSLIPPKRPGPSPLLERGGWVRTKSGSSIITAASAKRLAVTGNSGHQRSKSLPVHTVHINSQPAVMKPSAKRPTTTLSDQHDTQQHYLKASTKHDAVNEIYQEVASVDLRRPPSMLLVPADFFSNQVISELDSYSPPPRPPKVPLHARPNARSRPRPDSTATFLTASTRLGEIPESKWPDRMISEEEQVELPLPYVIPPPLESPSRRSRGFKFWKKPKKTLDTTVVN